MILKKFKKHFLASLLIISYCQVANTKVKQIDKDLNADNFYSILENEEKNIDVYKTRVVLEQQLNSEQAYAITFAVFIDQLKKSHPVLIDAEIQRELASAIRKEYSGAFDPSINSSTSFLRFNSSSAPGEEQNAFTSNNSIDYLSSYGAKLGLGAKYAEGDIKTPISPTGDAGEYFVSLQVPILRNAFYNEKNVKLKTATYKESISDFKFFYSKINLFSDASEAYWKWVAAKMKIDAEQSLLTIAENQLMFVKEQVDLGNLPGITQSEADREVNKRLGKVNLQLREFEQSSIKLAEYLWQKDLLPFGIPIIAQVPTEFDEPQEISREQINEAKLNALKNRPEFKVLNVSKEIVALEKKFAKNQMLPLLDLFVNSGVELGGDSIGPVINTGINISLPLRVRFAKGRLEQAEFTMKQLNLQERQAIQKLFLEIENHASAINRAYKRYIAAKEEVRLAKEVENGERERFEFGDSTLFVLIQRERSTVESKIDFINTFSDYYISFAKFQFAQGLI